MNSIKTACIYCASSTQIHPIYFHMAEELGKQLAHEGIRIVCGAGSNGLMGVLSDAALAAGGEVIGVIPQFMINEGWCHNGLTQVIAVNDMHERKQTMAQLSDAAIALPGGCGTLEELLEVITWKQLGLYFNPIVILNVNHYYDPLLEMFDKAIAENFMGAQHGKLWAVTDNASEAIHLIQTLPSSDTSLATRPKSDLY